MVKNKKLMGFLAFAPLILLVVGFVGIFGIAALMGVSAFAIGSAGTDMAAAAGSISMLLLMVAFFLSYGLVFLAVILAWVDIVWFIVLACKNPKFDTTVKVLWSIGIYCLNIFICPVYWWMYIRK